jgi:hypothetical protein
MTILIAVLGVASSLVSKPLALTLWENGEMRKLGKDLWRWLGNVFRLKTIGDLLGWWSTAAWQKAISVCVGTVAGYLSKHFGAPRWLVITSFVAAIPLMVLVWRKVYPVKPSPMSLEFTSLRSGTRAFPFPIGRQLATVIYVKNEQLATATDICNVRAHIQYLHKGKPLFIIREAEWFLDHAPGFAACVDLAPNESQPFAVFMVGDFMKHPQSAREFNDLTRDLYPGKWSLRITITADAYPPIYAEIELTVYQEAGQKNLSVGCQPPMGSANLHLTKPRWALRRMVESVT